MRKVAVISHNRTLPEHFDHVIFLDEKMQWEHKFGVRLFIVYASWSLSIIVLFIYFCRLVFSTLRHECVVIVTIDNEESDDHKSPAEN